MLGLMVLVCFVGCKREEKSSRLFGVTFQTMNNPFFVDLKEGMLSMGTATTVPRS